MFISPQPLLARERVRYIGEPVALVVAETLDQAKDAAELIEVEYEDLPAVTTLEEAIAPGAPAVWDGLPRQRRLPARSSATRRRPRRPSRRPRTSSATACVISRLTTVVDGAARLPRRIRSARGPLHAALHRRRGRTRRAASSRKEIFKVPETKVRVIAENVGGGFGMKGALYPEYIARALAARMLGRPVKWMSDRSEAFLSDEHCRDNISEAELALDQDGKFLGAARAQLLPISAPTTAPTAAPGRRPTISACSPAPIRSRSAMSR